MESSRCRMVCCEMVMRPDALAAEDRRHRRQQRRPPVQRKAGIGDAEIVDPRHFGIEPDHLAERQDDADQQHRADQRVEPGIGEEGDDDLLVEHEQDQRTQHQKHQHPHQENPGRRQFCQLDLHRGAGGGRHMADESGLGRDRFGPQYGTATAGKQTKSSCCFRHSFHGIIIDIIPSMEYLADELARRKHR